MHEQVRSPNTSGLPGRGEEVTEVEAPLSE